MPFLRIIALTIVFLTTPISTWAGFTTNEFGSGKYTDGSSVGDILNNLLGTDGAQQISLSDLSALATALGSADSFDYSNNASLALFDTDNDGSISEQEFVDVLSAMSTITGVMTSGNGKYAEAYATELGNISAPITTAKIQAAITAGNSYAVDAPQIQQASLTFNGTNASHSASLGVLDGLGNSMDNSSGKASMVFSATHPSDSSATSRFEISSSGQLQLASGVDVEDLSAGTYTISVTATDINTDSYGLSNTTDVSLTVSNENGCIINNGIQSANFSVGDNTSSISGATVTISGSHNTNDKLFLRQAGSTSVDNSTGDVTYSSLGISGISAVYDKSSGELKFTGSAVLSDWITVFKKVGYIYASSDNTTATGSRSLIFSLSNRIPYNHSDGNVHFYDFISQNNITFENALDAAKATSNKLFGLQGYLVTVTSQTEQEYIEPKLDGRGWMGACDRLDNTSVRGYCDVLSSEISGLTGRPWASSNGSLPQAAGEGYWYWVTGPERLDYIGRDTGNCNHTYVKNKTYGSGDSFDKANSQSSYTNFKNCEPNNYLSSSGDGPGENHLHFYTSGDWNDYGNVSGQIQGYIVEWGGMSGDPSVDLTADKTYNIATEGQFCAHQ